MKFSTLLYWTDASSGLITKITPRGKMVRSPHGDLLQRYFDGIRPLPRLTREEELALASRYRASGDREALCRLVGANLRLVAKIALKFHKNKGSLLDFIQEGNLGLLHAIERYDPARGLRLSSYATWWIRAYIFRFTQTNRLIRVGTTNAGR